MIPYSTMPFQFFLVASTFTLATVSPWKSTIKNIGNFTKSTLLSSQNRETKLAGLHGASLSNACEKTQLSR